MKRAWIVARHEFVTQLRRRSFLFMAFVFPLLIAGGSILAGTLSARQAERSGALGQIGVVDASGLLAAEVEKPPEVVAYAGEPAAAAALEAGEIGAYFVVPAGYLETGTVDAYARDVIPGSVEKQFEAYLEANLAAGHPGLPLERLRQPAHITLATMDGHIRLDEESGIVMIMTPILFAVLFTMSITMTSSYMMQNVVEEKETRMVEILTTSITPLQLLWGKIIGLGGLGLLQIGTWAVAGAAAIVISQDLADVLATLHYPWWLLALALVYLLLGYILYGSLLSGIGASSSSMQEAQPIAALLSLLGVSPLFFLAAILENPNGFWPVFLSLLPFTAPATMLLRLVLGQVPPWQVGLSLALLLAAIAAVVWLAAWVFRIGLLLTGKRLTPRALLQAMRSGDKRVAVVVAASQGGEGR
jgi:ABC-2 type transport system permease protein